MERKKDYVAVTLCIYVTGGHFQCWYGLFWHMNRRCELTVFVCTARIGNKDHPGRTDCYRTVPENGNEKYMYDACRY